MIKEIVFIKLKALTLSCYSNYNHKQHRDFEIYFTRFRKSRIDMVHRFAPKAYIRSFLASLMPPHMGLISISI